MNICISTHVRSHQRQIKKGNNDNNYSNSTVKTKNVISTVIDKIIKMKSIEDAKNFFSYLNPLIFLFRRTKRYKIK